MSSKHIDLLAFSELPAPVYFRYADFNTHEYASAHRHPWGTLEYSANGVLHMEIGSSRFMSPPQYAVWVPPHTEHSFYSNQPINYRAVCLAPSLCQDLPAQACTLAISDILKAILKDFAARDVKIPEQEADKRLAQCWWINCNRRRCKSVTCPTPAARACLEYWTPCKPRLGITGHWPTGRNKSMSASGRWRASVSASWG